MSFSKLYTLALASIAYSAIGCTAATQADEEIEASMSTSSAYSYSGTQTTNFDSNNQGWKLNYFNELTMVDATWDSANKSIKVDDFTDGDTFQFTAPWKGNLTNYYNGTLSFKLKDVYKTGGSGSGARSANNQGLQIIAATADSWLELNHPLAAPGSDYTSYSIKLAPDGKWWKHDGSKVTSADFKAILGKLSYIRIVAEYIDGNDTCSLDSVSLVPPTTTTKTASVAPYVTNGCTSCP